MNRLTDPMDTLVRLRPASTVDTLWPEPRRVTTLERVMSDQPAPARRRRLAVAVLAGGLVLAGVGAAATGGVLQRALSFWATETGGGVDAASARRVAQGPGPGGLVLSVWAAEGSDGTLCVSPLFEAPGDLARPAPADFALAGGECAPAAVRDEPFGSSLGGSADAHGVHTMWGPAGAAARADVRLPDGTVRPAVVAMGMFFCWYEVDRAAAAPSLIGYDAGGGVVGEAPLPNLVAAD